MFIFRVSRFSTSILQQIFLKKLCEEDRDFVLEYLSSGKGCFPYEVVTDFKSLSVKPEDGKFWPIDLFYSRLRDEGIFVKEWEGGKKPYKMLRMRNLRDFNDVYNIQDVYILGVILEYRSQKIKEATGFDPRCFTSSSTLSGAIERIKSKVILTFPTNTETVLLMESLLSGETLLIKLETSMGRRMRKRREKNLCRNCMTCGKMKPWPLVTNPSIRLG